MEDGVSMAGLGLTKVNKYLDIFINIQTVAYLPSISKSIHDS